MRDLTSARWIYLKAGLLLFLGVFAGGLLLWESPGWRTLFLLAVCVWGLARAYFFAFYVVEHYVDPAYKFSGLGSFLLYLIRRRDKSSAHKRAE